MFQQNCSRLQARGPTLTPSVSRAQEYVMKRSRFVGSIVALAAAGSVMLAGCGGRDPEHASAAAVPPAASHVHSGAPAGHAPAPNVVSLTAADFRFDVPKEIPAGTTEIVLQNHGAETHQASLVRLAEGATADQFLGALAQDFGSAAQYGTFVAGPNESAPGHATSVVTDLEPGNYLVVCLIPSPDGTPHVLKGMMAQVTVTPPAGRPRAVDDDAPTLVLKEFSFDLPNGYEGGPLEIVNEGEQNHEVVVVGLPDGVDLQDVIDSTVPILTPAKGPAPYVDVAGITPVAPKGRARLDLDLPPGRYALLCFLPDTTTHDTDHLHNGMATVFTVS
jgi:hypothetical protein